MDSENKQDDQSKNTLKYTQGRRVAWPRVGSSLAIEFVETTCPEMTTAAKIDRGPQDREIRKGRGVQGPFERRCMHDEMG